MSFKFVIFICYQALAFRDITGQAIPSACNSCSMPFEGFSYCLPCIGSLPGLPILDDMTRPFYLDQLPVTNGGLFAASTRKPDFSSASNAPYSTAVSGLAASRGGSFSTFSSSSISPTGMSIVSENAIKGDLAVAGRLPFVGVVGFEGSLPTAGMGSIGYKCGNGDLVMMTEDLVAYARIPFGYDPFGSLRRNGPGFRGKGFAFDR